MTTYPERPEAGWYPVNEGRQMGYFDGATWTDDRVAGPAPQQSNTAAPGWYPTLTGRGYWDGSQWVPVRTGAATASVVLAVLTWLTFALSIAVAGADPSGMSSGIVILLFMIPLAVAGLICGLVALGHGPLVRSRAWVGVIVNGLAVATPIIFGVLGAVLMP